jgi:hypothetical protein
MKIADVAPDEAQLVDISEKLSAALADPGAPHETETTLLDLDSSYLEAARTMLANLTQPERSAFDGAVELTEQQIENYLDFSPEFLDTAKAMLRDFIDRTESSRHR